MIFNNQDSKTSGSCRLQVSRLYNLDLRLFQGRGTARRAPTISRHPSASDLQYIEKQLGRKARGIMEISARSKNGNPLVVKTKPVLNNEVFPTLYYLVCGSVIEQVSKLESEGLLAELQQKVDMDKNFRRALLKAQQEYRKERNDLVDVPLNESQKEALETGIGGVKKLDRIKCLHCHLAHYLAGRDNPVGKIAGDTLAMWGHPCFTKRTAGMSPHGKGVPIRENNANKPHYK